MTKRRRFILTSALLTLGFIGVQLLSEQHRFLSIGLLGFFTVVLFYWSLREGMAFNMTLLSLVLPFLFTIGVGLFWFLLPTSVFTRIPILIVYGLGIYALCLTANIFTVSAIRTIALLRAARGVGFVLTLFTSFLLYDTVLSLRVSLLATILLVLLVSFPLFLQGFWVIPLDRSFSKEVFKKSLIASIVIAEVSAIMYFWPVTVVVGSLFFTISVYMLLGLGQAKLEGRLFTQTVREYLILGLFVFLGMFFATRWGG